ncbi:MAG: hypothetical protein ABII12_00280 [Planctomycetota bacterium]
MRIRGFTKQVCCMTAFVGVVCVGAGPAAAEHEHDVWIGRSGTGQLKISPSGFVPEDHGHALVPVNGPLLFGWTDNDPGFDAVSTDDLPNDIYVLQPGAEIWLELVAIDPALRLIDNGFQVIDEPGESTLLGDETLHVHNTWHIDSTHPAYNPDQYLWHATFVLRDDGSTNYATSEPLVFSFINCTPGYVEETLLAIEDFVAMLLDDAGYATEERCAADMNADGRIDGADIQPYVELLLPEE